MGTTNMKNKIFLTAFDAGISRAHCDASGTWRVEHLVADHRVTCLANDPSNPQIVFAGTRNGVLRSDDWGQSWRLSGMSGWVVKSLAVSPHDSNVVYAGTKPALMFSSGDGGQTWAELTGFRRIPNRWWWFSPAELPDRRPYVQAIAPSPAKPGTLLAGVELGAVVRSDDGGQTWSRHRRGALRDCHSLKYHATNGNWVYEAGGSGGGAAFSQDGGLTFRKVRQGLAKNYGLVCAADPESPEIWYMCVAPSPYNAFGKEPEIYFYRNREGTGWQPIGWQAHPLRVTPTALTTVPGNPGHLYAGLYNGDIWHTTDYGDSWVKMPFNVAGIWFSMLVI